MRHFWSIFLLVAIIGSFVVGNTESANRDNRQRVQLVQGCIRGSARQAFTVALGDELAKGRVERGEPRKAARAQAIADASIQFIAAPDADSDLGIVNAQSPRELVRVVIDFSTSPPTARLTKRAAELQEAGCREAFA